MDNYMDPKTALRQMIYCTAKMDFYEALEYACALENWRKKGGLMPEMNETEREIFKVILALDGIGDKACSLYDDEDNE